MNPCRRPLLAVATLAAMVALAAAGCDRHPQTVLAQPDPPAAPASAVPAPSLLQGWLGRWNGPGDTYLHLVALPDARYEITIKNATGERAFKGVSGEDHVYFERDGVIEKIRAADGAGTGLKWTADKSRCLVIGPGEVFCRG